VEYKNPVTGKLTHLMANAKITIIYKIRRIYMGRATVISFQNAKGGVGKTTISLNVSHLLSLAGYHVLHCDFDEQGSSSEAIDVYSDDYEKIPIDYFRDYVDFFPLFTEEVDIKEYIYHSRYNMIDIIPSTRVMASVVAGNSFDRRFERCESVNKNTAFLDNLNQVKDKYDYIVIDGQPSVNQLMMISIMASDYVLVPVEPDTFNSNTVLDIAELVMLLNKNYKLNIQFKGFFFNKFAPKEVGDAILKEQYESIAANYYIDCPIRYSKPVAQKSFMSGQLFLEYSKNSNPSIDLLNLVIHHLGLIDEAHMLNLIKNGINRKTFQEKKSKFSLFKKGE